MSNAEAAHAPKEYHIIVNGRQRAVTEKEISFEEVIRFAFDPLPTGENVIFTVTYRRGEGNKPEGSMVAGDVVKVKEGMIFDARATDRA
jgi:hypothetical protein